MTNTAVAKQPTNTLQQLIVAKEKQFKTLLPKHITPERFMRIIFMQTVKNQDLLACTQETVLQSVLVAAELGLTPDGRHGALVPFNNKKKGVKECTFIPMYQGLIDLARRSGQIADIFATKVCENDDFTFELGLHRDLKHVPAFKDRGNAIAYYCVVEFKDGTKTFGSGPMMLDEVKGIQKRAQAQSGPWVTDFDAMALKTVIKRVLKFCPLSNELSKAVAIDNDAFGDAPEPLDLDEMAKEQQRVRATNAALINK